MENKSQVRNGALDVFRCACMFLIVLGHTYHYGVSSHTSWVLNALFSYLICWHVDAFTALSGWFGIKTRFGKFLKIYGIVVFYSCLSIFVGRFFLGMNVPLRITGGWYGNTYLCLMLIAPLLNAGIDSLAQKGRGQLGLAWLGFAAVVWINWFSGNSYVGFIAYDVAPFTLIQLAFVYITVRAIRKTELVNCIRLWHLIAMGVIFVCIAIALPGPRLNYLAPHTIAMSVVMLVLFEKYLRFPNWMVRMSSWMAPSMFGIYLLHEVCCFGRSLFRFPLNALTGRGMPPFVAVITSACFCFVACLGVDILRRQMLKWCTQFLRGRVK